MSWVAVVAETAVIIANQYPSADISKRILSALFPKGLPDDICVTPMFVTGSLLASLGYLIRIKCYKALGSLFTFEVGIHKGHKLVTDGPYSIVRHPSYTASIMLFAGVNCCQMVRGSWVRECGMLSTWAGKIFVACWIVGTGAASFGLAMRAPKEDKLMKKQFGKEWVEWTQRVPYRLVPGIY